MDNRRNRRRHLISNLKRERHRGARAEAARLCEMIRERAPDRNYNVFLEAPPEGAPPPTHFGAAATFEELPLSQATLRGLRHRNYMHLTPIQGAALPHALAGRDILGTAETGTGKTLCFVIPVLEALFRLGWTAQDGLGALVLSPTRELALQTFNVFRAVGAAHDMSAALITGGKSFAEEAARLQAMNVVVATPGRLLQHADESPSFQALAVRVLVLDEADKLLELGFATQLDGILAAIAEDPEGPRQTLLFSATNAASVDNLARLTLRDPVVLTSAVAQTSRTPGRLMQSYLVLRAEDKLNALVAFLKAHLRRKVLVFFATQRQVRFVAGALGALNVGTAILALHGHLAQATRTQVFQSFGQRAHAALLATDVAARGLDFARLDWVVQVDAPETTEAYVHRVGRTARFLRDGRAIALFTPAEATIWPARLRAHGLAISRTTAAPAAALLDVAPALQAILIRNPKLVDAAKRAVRAYFRSLTLAGSLAAKDIDHGAFMRSFGLSDGVIVTDGVIAKDDVESELVSSPLLGLFDVAADADTSADTTSTTCSTTHSKRIRAPRRIHIEEITPTPNDAMTPIPKQDQPFWTTVRNELDQFDTETGAAAKRRREAAALVPRKSVHVVARARRH